MATVNIQSREPQIAEAEARLLDILQGLSQLTIQEVEVGDFLDDLLKEPGSRDGNLNFSEEKIGVRLLLRILDQVFVRVYTRLSDANSSKQSHEEEKNILQKEIKSLKLKLRNSVTSSAKEIQNLKTENKRLKALLECAKVDTPKSEEISLKRKKTPVFQNEKLDGTPNTQKSGSRIFRKNISPNKAVLLSSTQAHMEDASFVPETLQVASPGCRKSTRFGGNSSVPETPEKEMRASGIIEQCVTPESKASPVLPRSPLISRPSNPSVNNKKRKLFLRTVTAQVPRENKSSSSRTDSVKNSKSMKAKASTTEDSNVLTEVADEVNVVFSKKVGKIDTGAQKEIDRKSFRQFDDDFPKKTPKRSEYFRNLPSDTDSDFESPNLLKKPKLKEKSKKNDEAAHKENAKSNIFEDVFENDADNDIDMFNSPNDEVEVEVKLKKKKSKTSGTNVRSENRWGIEYVKELSDSNKKSLSKRQSRIDGFFKNPPKTPAPDDMFVRVNQADTDMEKAIEESLKSTEGIKEVAGIKNINSDRKEEEVETKDIDHEKPDKTEAENETNSGPNFAYVGPAVRKKEERKKLRGFDCGECREYYHQKLEEGFSKDQILKLMNNCSKHRGIFKPPLTPEKFWDVDIVEDDSDDPRSRTQTAPPLKSRSQRRAAAKLKRKL